jgi:hypothetical protein
MEKAGEEPTTIKNRNFRLSMVAWYYMRIKSEKKGDG